MEMLPSNTNWEGTSAIAQTNRSNQVPRGADTKHAKRVLIYRLGSLGDTVGAVPALHVIERAFPDARRLLLTNLPVHAKAPAAFAIIGGSNLVHGYISYPIGMRLSLGLLRLWWQIVRFRPDVLVYLTTGQRGEAAVRRDATFFRLCGIRRLVGLPIGELAENRYDPEHDLWESEASRLLRCMSPLGVADVNDLRNWDLHLTKAEIEKGDEVLRTVAGHPIIACGPGTKMQAKDWGQDNWLALMSRLAGEFPHHALVLIGAPDDAAVSNYAAAKWQGPVVNLCGRLTPRESAAVIRRAELFLGPDSGPMHMAAAYGVPCANVFASIDRRGRWFPVGSIHRPVYHNVECSNCRIEVCIEKKKICINSITVDEMFVAAMEAWNNGQVAKSQHSTHGAKSCT